MFEKTLLVHDVTVLQFEASHMLAAERSKKRVAGPAWISIAGVDGQSRRRDRRHPVDDRLIHAVARRVPGNGAAVVVDAERDGGPPIVVARLDDVDLVSAAGSMFVLPDRARIRLDEQPLRVTQAVGNNLWPDPRTAVEWIVGRDRPIFVQPQDLALVVAEILRRLLFVAIADRHVDGAVQSERNARAAVAAVGVPGIGDEELADVAEHSVLEPRAA